MSCEAFKAHKKDQKLEFLELKKLCNVEKESITFLVEGCDEIPSEYCNIIFLVEDMKWTENADTGWRIQNNDNLSANALNFVKVLLPGFIVLDESYLPEYSKLLELRKLEAFQKGATEITVITKNISVLKRSWDVRNSFIFVANMDSEKQILKLEEAEHRKVATSSPLSAYMEG